MILAVNYKEVFSRNIPSFSRSWIPETTDLIPVEWVYQRDGFLFYKYTGEMHVGVDRMSSIESYETITSVNRHKYLRPTPDIKKVKK